MILFKNVFFISKLMNEGLKILHFVCLSWKLSQQVVWVYDGVSLLSQHKCKRDNDACFPTVTSRVPAQTGAAGITGAERSCWPTVSLNLLVVVFPVCNWPLLSSHCLNSNKMTQIPPNDSWGCEIRGGDGIRHMRLQRARKKERRTQ